MSEPRCSNCNDLIALRDFPTHCYKCNYPLPDALIASYERPKKLPFYAVHAFLITVGACVAFMALIFVIASFLNIKLPDACGSAIAVGMIAGAISLYQVLVSIGDR